MEKEKRKLLGERLGVTKWVWACHSPLYPLSLILHTAETRAFVTSCIYGSIELFQSLWSSYKASISTSESTTYPKTCTFRIGQIVDALITTTMPSKWRACLHISQERSFQAWWIYEFLPWLMTPTFVPDIFQDSFQNLWDDHPILLLARNLLMWFNTCNHHRYVMVTFPWPL